MVKFYFYISEMQYLRERSESKILLQFFNHQGGTMRNDFLAEGEIFPSQSLDNRWLGIIEVDGYFAHDWLRVVKVV